MSNLRSHCCYRHAWPSCVTELRNQEGGPERTTLGVAFGSTEGGGNDSPCALRAPGEEQAAQVSRCWGRNHVFFILVSRGTVSFQPHANPKGRDSFISFVFQRRTVRLREAK